MGQEIKNIVQAQQFGEITGTITDATGAVVSGANITVSNTATAQVRSVLSNDSGNYSLPYLNPGSYNIRVERSGFKVSSRAGVDVQVGNVDRLDFRLEIGEVSQQIEVSAGAPAEALRQLHGKRVVIGVVHYQKWMKQMQQQTRQQGVQ